MIIVEQAKIQHLVKESNMQKFLWRIFYLCFLLPFVIFPLELSLYLLRPFHYSIGWILFKPVLSRVTRVHGAVYAAKSNKAGLIVAVNHVAYQDILILGGLFPLSRPLHFMGKNELLDVPVLRMICGGPSMIAVDRENKFSAINLRAIRRAIKILKKSGIIVVFMQGGINKTDIKRTPVELAMRTGASILPIYLEQKTWFHSDICGNIDVGSYDAHIGKIIHLRELGDGKSDILAERLWQKIIKHKSL